MFGKAGGYGEIVLKIHASRGESGCEKLNLTLLRICFIADSGRVIGRGFGQVFETNSAVD